MNQPDAIKTQTASPLPPPVIIAFTGPAGAGKSTAARHLMDEHGFTRVRFASPLKAMLATLLNEQGVGFAMAWRMIDGDLKETSTPYLAGRTPRQAMQWLGTEWGRDLIGPNFWVDAWRNAVAKAQLDALVENPEAPARIVVDDCRFFNEATTVHALGGTIVRVHRPGAAALAGAHISEQCEIPANWAVYNVHDIPHLEHVIEGLIGPIIRP